MSTPGCHGAMFCRSALKALADQARLRIGSLLLFVQIARESRMRSALIVFATCGGNMVKASYFIHVLNFFSSTPCNPFHMYHMV